MRTIHLPCNQVESTIVHFTVACLVAKPLNRSEAKDDLVMIQTLLLFKYKLLCYHADQILVPITTWSPSALLQIKDLVTKYTTVEWPVVERAKTSYNQIFKEPPFLLVLQDVVKVLIFAVSNKSSMTPKSSLDQNF